METIVGLHRKHRARRLQAADNILALEHLEELLPKLAAVRKEHGIDWVIFFEAKSNPAPRQMDALAAAGVTELQLGIESLSTPVLKLMRGRPRDSERARAQDGAKPRNEHQLEFDLRLSGRLRGRLRENGGADSALTHLEPPSSFAPIRIDLVQPVSFRLAQARQRPPDPA